MQMSKWGLMAAGVAMVAAGPAFAGIEGYGKANVSYQLDDSNGEDAFKLHSNASRLGVKGSHALGSTLEAIYKAEYEIAVDDGDPTFKQRNIYAGLKGNFGAVFAGTHDTPVKIIGKVADQFNDYNLGDIKQVVVGENRMKNTVSYQSPKFAGGLKIWAMFIPGEEQGGDNNGPADGISASVTYKRGGFHGAVGFDSDVKGADVIRGAASYKFGPAKLAALVQSSEASEGDSDNEVGIVLSGSAKVSKKDKLKLQFSVGDEKAKGGQLISAGWDHKFTKQSKVYAFASFYEDDGGDANDDTRIGVGIEHKFSSK